MTRQEYCEDYPACGHTPQDPCWREWYDEPGAFDTSIPGHEHRLCDHENGECDVVDDDPDDGPQYTDEQLNAMSDSELFDIHCDLSITDDSELLERVEAIRFKRNMPEDNDDEVQAAQARAEAQWDDWAPWDTPLAEEE